MYASKAKCGQALGYYGGGAITLQEYYELHEKTVYSEKTPPLKSISWDIPALNTPG